MTKLLPQSVTSRIRDQVDHLATWDDFTALVRFCMKVDCLRLTHDSRQSLGNTIQSGPFAGMLYADNASEGGYVSRLLGCYERSLHPIVELVIKSGYEVVLDIGSAEGYYAVGLASRMQDSKVIAYDINPRARDGVKALIESNKLEGRIEVRELCTHSDFDIALEKSCFVICDIEGAEDFLLDPQKAPGLKHADILVETHPHFSRDITSKLQERFSETHDIELIGRELNSQNLPSFLDDASDYMRLLALWEWREHSTPWLWMKRK